MFYISISIVLLLLCLQLFEWTINSPSHTKYVSHTYKLVDEYAGSTFFDGFNYEDIPDPTHGHVMYKSRRDAIAMNLTYVRDNTAYIHVDSVSPSPNGRASVRLSSKKTYTHGLFLLDVQHMPEGCGTWPAFWTTALPWPHKGEIDILEGVNLETDNAFTLHTPSGCRQHYSTMKGTPESYDCDVNSPMQWPNQGCGVKTKNSFGREFNKRGGVVAMEWTESRISMWIGVSGDKSTWGIPDAVFDDTECDLSIFRDHVVIINTTLCGDWAGNAYTGCPGTCTSFVSDNPSEFVDAYWAIRSLKIYQY